MIPSLAQYIHERSDPAYYNYSNPSWFCLFPTALLTSEGFGFLGYLTSILPFVVEFIVPRTLEARSFARANLSNISMCRGSSSIKVLILQLQMTCYIIKSHNIIIMRNVDSHMLPTFRKRSDNNLNLLFINYGMTCYLQLSCHV